jgi:uncharacterized Zn finger protein
MIAELLTEKNVRRIAGNTYFARGAEYFSSGCVRDLRENNGRVTATVDGSHDYAVALWDDGGTLEYSCTCPLHAGDGAFCKHCVATALAWLRQPKTKAGKVAAKHVTEADVRTFLLKEKKETLAETLLEWARDDPKLWKRLELRTSAASGKSVDVDAYRRLIERAMRAREYVDYRNAYGFTREMHDAIDALEKLLRLQPATLVELCEHALAQAEYTVENMDDSDGYTSGVFERLHELHLRACMLAKPDPLALAERLFEWELSGSWDTFHRAAQTHAKALGRQGLAHYRDLARAEWEKFPQRAPGDKPTGYDARRSRITRIMETLAELAGDVEAQVEILRRDLSHPYSFLRIAELYRGARKRDPALDWAERGLKAFASRPDPRLEDFVAEEYRRRKRNADALDIVWKQFERGPTLESYRKLHAYANSAHQWPQWRERALDTIRRCIEQERGCLKTSRWTYAQPDRSLLVEIHLWENDPETAWNEAKSGGCSSDLWLRLAELREADRPADAIGVYRQLIDPIVNEKNNDAYARAAKLLRKVHTLMSKTDRGDEFAQYVAAVRAAHKPKRNFVALLDRVAKMR